MGHTSSRWSCSATSAFLQTITEYASIIWGFEIEQLARRRNVTSRVVCALDVWSRRRLRSGCFRSTPVLVRSLRKTTRRATGDRPRDHADRSRGRAFSRYTITRSRKSRHQNRVDKPTVSDFEGVGGAGCCRRGWVAGSIHSH